MEATTGNGKERVRRWGRVVLKRVDAWKPLYWVWRLIKKVISAHCNSFIQEIWLCWPTIGWRVAVGGRGVYSAYVADTKASDLPTPTQPTFSSPEPVVSFELGTRMRRTRVYSIVFRSVYFLKCFLSLVRCHIEELKNHAIFQERLASWKRGKSGEISIPHKLGFSEISLPQSLLPSNVQILYLMLINLFIIVFILLVIHFVWQNNK